MPTNLPTYIYSVGIQFMFLVKMSLQKNMQNSMHTTSVHIGAKNVYEITFVIFLP